MKKRERNYYKYLKQRNIKLKKKVTNTEIQIISLTRAWNMRMEKHGNKIL